MTGFDYAVIAIIVLSALIGLWRGLVYEMLTLAGWGAAFLAAQMFAPVLAPLMPVNDESMQMIIACAAIFIGVLIACGILAWLLSKAMKWVGLGWMDASLGFVFGAARGLLAVLALVLLAGLTDLPQQPFWQEAQLSQPLEMATLVIKEKLPLDAVEQLHY